MDSETSYRIRSGVIEGRVISGRYRLESKLGQGGMGSVYRALHLELGTPVAIKLIEPTIAESNIALARFKREAQAAASLRSNNVVQILDYGIEDGTPYMVMELLEGESLAARIARQGVLSPALIINVVSQVGKALERAHAMNIVHRDLKPDNIFLTPDDEDIVAKVLDFGIAKTHTSALFESTIQTKSGAILGTPHYMSPEQASGRGLVDYRADIWALGVIVFECFTGFRPFAGNTLGGLIISICSDPIPRPSERGSVPLGLDAWFAKAVSRSKDDRFASMVEAVTSLRRVCEPENGRPVEHSENGLHREPTVIERDVNPGTVSTSARTLGSSPKRHTIVKWGLFVILLGILSGIPLLSRRLRQSGNGDKTHSPNSTALRPETGIAKRNGSEAFPTIPSTTISNQVALDLAASPGSALTTSASAKEAPRAIPPNRKSIKVTGSLAKPEESREGISTRKKSESVLGKAPKPSNGTRPTRNIEDRLAF